MEKPVAGTGSPRKRETEAVIAPTAADRAEAHGAAFFVFGFEREFDLVDGAGIVFETAHDGRIDDDPIRTIAGCGDEFTYRVKFVAAFLSNLAVAQPRIDLRARFDGANHEGDVVGLEAGSLGEIAGFVLASVTKQLLDTGNAETIELVDGTHDGQPLSVIRNAKRVPYPIEHLAVVHLHHVAAAGNAERFHRFGRHHAHLGIGRGRRGAHRVGVELHELAEAAGAGLFVAVDVARSVAAVRLRQRVEIFRDIARQRRGQVVAQRDPLLVVVLEREHALVRPVLVGQEFAERVGELHRRGLHRLETVALIDLADFLDHLARGRNCGRATIFQPARQPRLQFLLFFRFFSHGRVGTSQGAMRQPLLSACTLSFQGASKTRTRNLEIPGSMLRIAPE